MENYELITVQGKYIRNYNNAPHVVASDSYFLQKNDSCGHYRGVKVYFKETLNLDGTNRGYIVLKTSIKSFTPKLYDHNLKKVIDGRFNELERLINEKPLLCNYNMNKDLDYKIEKTAIDTMCTKRYTRLQKRYILSDLINKGLSKIYALDFLSFL